MTILPECEIIVKIFFILDYWSGFLLLWTIWKLSRLNLMCISTSLQGKRLLVRWQTVSEWNIFQLLKTQVSLWWWSWSIPPVARQKECSVNNIDTITHNFTKLNINFRIREFWLRISLHDYQFILGDIDGYVTFVFSCSYSFTFFFISVFQLPSAE